MLMESDKLDVRLVRDIGQGTYGTVYKAVWHGNLVATKIIQVHGDDFTCGSCEVERCSIILYTSVVIITH